MGGEGEISEKSEKFKFSLFLFKSSKKYLIKIFQLSKLIFLEFYDFFLRLVGNCNTNISKNGEGSRAAVFCNIWVTECGGYVPFVSAAPDAP